jgi:hypothetical protein
MQHVHEASATSEIPYHLLVMFCFTELKTSDRIRIVVFCVITLCSRVQQVDTNVSGERVTSIFRVKVNQAFL